MAEQTWPQYCRNFLVIAIACITPPAAVTSVKQPDSLPLLLVVTGVATVLVNWVIQRALGRERALLAHLATWLLFSAVISRLASVNGSYGVLEMAVGAGVGALWTVGLAACAAMFRPPRHH